MYLLSEIPIVLQGGLTLVRASRAGDETAVTSLLDSGADPHFKDIVRIGPRLHVRRIYRRTCTCTRTRICTKKYADCIFAGYIHVHVHVHILVPRNTLTACSQDIYMYMYTYICRYMYSTGHVELKREPLITREYWALDLQGRGLKYEDSNTQGFEGLWKLSMCSRDTGCWALKS